MLLMSRENEISGRVRGHKTGYRTEPRHVWDLKEEAEPGQDKVPPLGLMNSISTTNRNLTK